MVLDLVTEVFSLMLSSKSKKYVQIMDMSFLFGRVAQSARCFPVTDLTECHVKKYSVLGFKE